MNASQFSLGLAWLTAVVLGSGVLLVYDYSPGMDRAVPKIWPAQTQIPRANNLPALVLFAHPKCPCTRASIGELATLMARCQGKVNAQVIFVRPKGTKESWTRTDLWQTARSIPGVKVFSDEEAVEARRFNASTSGHVVLYDPQGHLMFSGGITAARGHAGDNVGRFAVTELLHRRTAAHGATPVFGCSLRASRAQCSAEDALCQH